MNIILWTGLVLATLIMIAIHHLGNWGLRKAISSADDFNDGDGSMVALGVFIYLLLNILYIEFLYIIFTELNKIS
jgi:hypothetical protein